MVAHCVRWSGALLLMAATLGDARAQLSARKKEAPPAHDVPLELLGERQRQLAKQVLDKPAFSAKGPPETFRCKPEQYRFLLDHPDRAVPAWRKLGAKCVTIANRGEQQFGWSDDQGSDVTWETIHRGAELQIWYADGKVRPAKLMPLVPVKAVVAVKHKQLKDADGATLVQHQSDLYVQSDNKSIALVTKMLGPATQHVAEQGLGQLQLFFSGLSWYLDRHPERLDELLGGKD